jgi:hypothetical protein
MLGHAVIVEATAALADAIASVDTPYMPSAPHQAHLSASSLANESKTSMRGFYFPMSANAEHITTRNPNTNVEEFDSGSYTTVPNNILLTIVAYKVHPSSHFKPGKVCTCT